jgi:hypothetical protein
MTKKVKKIYDVSELKKDYFICWNVCTYSAYESSIKLVDENNHEYFNFYKPHDQYGSFKFLGQNFSICHGNKLQIIINAEVDELIKQSINSYNITDSNALTIGHGYNLCIEDSNDEDYNDIYINLVGWKKY